MSRRRTALICAAVAVLATVVPAAHAAKPNHRYDVTVRTTAYGVPHIVASRRARRRISSHSSSSICEKFIPRTTCS